MVDRADIRCSQKLLAALQAIEILVEAGAKLFRQFGAGQARRVAHVALFADLMLIDTRAKERQRGVECYKEWWGPPAW